MAIRISDDRLQKILDYFVFELEQSASEKQAFVATCTHFKIRPDTLRRYIGLAQGDELRPPPTEEEIRQELNQKLDLSSVRQSVGHWRNQAKYWKEIAESQQGIQQALAQFIPKFPVVPLPNLPAHSEYGEAMALAQWSDWHVYRTVSLIETEGRYEYNSETFYRLFWNMLCKMVDITTIQRSAHSVPNLWLVMGGDMLNDEHRIENVKSNEVYNAFGAFKLAVIAQQGIRFLLNHFSRIDIDCVVGNEPRIQEKKTAKHQWNNWDFVFYNILQIALKEEIRTGRVRMFVPLAPNIVVEQMGFNWLITHGDKAKSWNGIPYYGIGRFIMKQHDLRRPHPLHNPEGRDFHYTLMHDKHTSSSLDHDSVFVNGALCGTDEYASNVLSVGGPRMQRLMFVNSSYGPFCQYPLYPSAEESHPFVIPEATQFVPALSHELS